jgi:Na+/H+ antiporter NhaD/arsenite permease-like protein
MAIPHRPILLAIFALTYLGIAIGRVPRLQLNRVGIALLGAIAMMIVSASSAAATVAWVNWPAMFLLFGFFVLSAQLRLSGFFGRMAERLSASAGSPARFLLLVMAATAGLSTVLNHDIVCYVFTPVVATALQRRRLSPVPFLLAVALASNIGAAATLIGNAQDILIGEVAHLGFRQYLQWSFVPVTVTLALAYGWVLRGVRRESALAGPATAGDSPAPEYPFDPWHTAKGLVIFAVVIGLCFTRLPKELVVLAAAGVHLASPKFRTDDLLGLVDWPILILFLSLFVVTGGFAATGYAEQAVHWLEGAGFSPTQPATEALLTAGVTAALNNAPAVMLLLKLVPLGHPLAAYILALANSFSGNILLTASVSNLIVVQQARRQGITISFRAFARLGLPVAAAGLAVLVGWAALVR